MKKINFLNFAFEDLIAIYLIVFKNNLWYSLHTMTASTVLLVAYRQIIFSPPILQMYNKNTYFVTLV